MSENPTRQFAAEHEYVELVVEAMNDEVASIERTGRVHIERVAASAPSTPRCPTRRAVRRRAA